MAYSKAKIIKPIVVKQAPPIPPRETEPYYARPNHAADIWFDGEALCLGFPPNADHVRGHVVKIPLAKLNLSITSFGEVMSNQLGWKALMDTIKARYSARSRHVKIAERGAITGYQLEQMLKTMTTKKYDSAGQRKTTLEDLGLDQ